MIIDNKIIQESVGKCPKCGEYPTWFNNVPLVAYCGGPDGKRHKEMEALVPSPVQPYGKIPKRHLGWKTANQMDAVLRQIKCPLRDRIVNNLTR